MSDEQPTLTNDDAPQSDGVRADAQGPDDASLGAGEPDCPIPVRLREPLDTNGVYVVLWARKPRRGERATWGEVAYVKASDPDVAKRRVLEHDGRKPAPIAERGEIARWLIEQAGVKPGILLRALPAMHWPAVVESTDMYRPEPELRIR